MAIEVYCDLHNINFSLEERDTVYTLMECNVDGCRFQINFKSATKHPPLISKIKDCTKAWKSRFFFVLFDMLGLPSGFHVSHVWTGASGCVV